MRKSNIVINLSEFEKEREELEWSVNSQNSCQIENILATQKQHLRKQTVSK